MCAGVFRSRLRVRVCSNSREILARVKMLVTYLLPLADNSRCEDSMMS